MAIESDSPYNLNTAVSAGDPMPEKQRLLKVFLCHARMDHDAVRALYTCLTQDGVDVWLDKERLLPGQDWELEIRKAVHEADVVVVCLSKQFNQAGFRQKEVRLALETAMEQPEGEIFIIPARLEECETLESLKKWHWVDLFEDEGYEMLLRALRARAERIGVKLQQRRGQSDGETAPGVKPEKITSEQRLLISQPPSPGIEKETLPSQTVAPRHLSTKIQSKPGAAVIVLGIGFVGSLLAVWWALSLIERRLPSSSVPTGTVSVTETIIATRTVLPTIVLPAKQPVLISTHTSEPSSTPTVVISTVTHTPTVTLMLSPTSLPARIIDSQNVEMLLVPAGEFKMGGVVDQAMADCRAISSICYRNFFENEEPIHTVNLDAFYIDTYEVTNRLYQACVESGICTAPIDTSMRDGTPYYGNPVYANYPVNHVTWEMAGIYCKWRGARLPTEAEWEKAARGTDGRTYPWGNSFTCNNANYGLCRKSITEVGIFKSGKSPYGLYDMSGNVSEWVSDWYSDTYYQISPSINPVGPESGEKRVIRGGAYMTYGGATASGRTSSRKNYPPAGDSDIIGFRCARAASP